MPFRSDEILWYNNGVWGQLGYAVPNFGENANTLNNSIAYLVSGMGRNLAAIMLHSDADSRTPPTINTLIRVHKLITRARTILAGRAVASNTPRMEPIHSTPAPEDFMIFPCPFFRVRNIWMREWAGLILNAMGEAMQHTENRIEYEISTDFAGLIGMYLQRVYVRMAMELFQVAAADAQKPEFVLTDAIFQSYNPAKYFTSTELIDTLPRLELVPTEDDLAVLTDGIPASKLVGLSRYPSSNPLQPNPTAPPATPTAAAAVASTPAFPPPPGP